MITFYWVIGLLLFAVPIGLMLVVAFMAMTDQATLEEQLEAAEWLQDVDEKTKN